MVHRELPERPLSIADKGRSVARLKRRNTRAAIEDAMEAISKDIEINDGIYPNSNGKISASEVLHRAGLSSAALQKPANRELRLEVNTWVRVVQSKLARGAKSVRKSVTDRVDSARLEMKQLRQVWLEAELEYVETIRQNAELREHCEELERENRRLRASIAGANIHSINQSTSP